MLDLDSILAEYRQTFIEKLDFKFQEIGIIELGFRENKYDREILKQLYFIIHSISGNSGMIGFPQLSKTSQEFELYLNEIIKSELSIKIDFEKIYLFIADLKKIYNETKLT